MKGLPLILQGGKEEELSLSQEVPIDIDLVALYLA